MDYASALKDLLRPLGIYAVDTGAGGAELDCIGTALNRIGAALETAEREALPLTAEGRGLSAWEALLPFAPESPAAADRRRALAALLRIDGGGFTLAAVNDTIAGCGIRAVVEETGTPQTVKVSFPSNRGIPAGFPGIRARIEQILPCHLDVEYVFLFVTWLELEALFPVWSALNGVGDWQTLERSGGEET